LMVCDDIHDDSGPSPTGEIPEFAEELLQR
jgi:hypothetical protein